jgi:putative transposase
MPQRRNQRWPIDFVSDAFACGRGIRIFAMVNDSNRQCVRPIAYTRTSGQGVARELAGRSANERGQRGQISRQSGNGG